jgi:hypothetical protein
MYKIPTVLNVEYLYFCVELLCFWVGPINVEPNTSRRIWYSMWCCDALSCVTTSLAASGLTFRSCMAKWRYQLRAYPTQLRVTRHRVGCDDTQKRWVWPRDLYFWGLGCHIMSHTCLSLSQLCPCSESHSFFFRIHLQVTQNIVFAVFVLYIYCIKMFKCGLKSLVSCLIFFLTFLCELL